MNLVGSSSPSFERGEGLLAIVEQAERKPALIDGAWPGDAGYRRSAICGRFKYVQDLASAAEQLFDLAVDPEEQVDLLLEPNAEATAVAKRLRRSLSGLPMSQAMAGQIDLSEAEKASLRSLGYLQ